MISILSNNLGALSRQLLLGGAAGVLIRIANLAFSLGLGILLARFLGADGYGAYAYAFSWLTLLLVLATFGMPDLQVREIAAASARGDWSLLKGVIRRGLQIVTAAAVLISITAFIVFDQFRSAFSDSEFTTLVLVLLLLPFVALLRCVCSALRGLYKVVLSQLIEMLARPACVFLGVLVIFLFDDSLRSPESAMSIQVLVAIVLFLFAYSILRASLPEQLHEVRPAFNTRAWLVSGLPLMAGAGAGVINSQADILLLRYFGSAEDVGIYRVAVQGAMLVVLGLNVANALIAPHFARLYAKGDMRNLQKLVTVSARLIFLSALPLALAFMLFGDHLAGWVFGPEFTASYAPLAILSFGQLVSATMGSVGFLLNMTGHEKDVAKVLVITSIMNVILNALLIPAFQLVGAACATAITLASWNIALSVIVKKRIGIDSSIITRMRADD